jgi:hypothetical protein
VTARSVKNKMKFLSRNFQQFIIKTKITSDAICWKLIRRNQTESANDQQ